MRQRFLMLGGCGRVGLPLAVALAEAHQQWRIHIYDANLLLLQRVRRGEFPYREQGAAGVFKQVLNRQLFFLPELTVQPYKGVLLCFDLFAGDGGDHGGEPVLLAPYLELFRLAEYVVVTSTLPPGGFSRLESYFQSEGIQAGLAYTPIRCAEGFVYQEMKRIPQIVSGRDSRVRTFAKRLFSPPARRVISLEPEEAELVKLFSNYWRYTTFSLANELFLIATSRGIDYHRIFRALTDAYPRARHLPPPGFTGGPCLPKDTNLLVQSLPFPTLGSLAMEINEHRFFQEVMHLLKENLPPSGTIGILGITFKKGSDDIRGGFAFRISEELQKLGYAVLLSDEYYKGPEITPLSTVLEEADLFVVVTPHPRYERLRTRKPVIRIGMELSARSKTLKTPP